MSVRTWGMSAFLNKILYSIHAAVDDRTGGQPDSGLPKPNRTGTVEMWRTAEAYLRCALFGSCRPRDVLSFCHRDALSFVIPKARSAEEPAYTRFVGSVSGSLKP